MKNTSILQTAERVSHQDPSDNFVFQRSMLAYEEAARLVSGTVLEIGTGSGYGLKLISSKAERFITVDKTQCVAEETLPQNALFIQMSVPKLSGIPNDSIDYVITFQLIEHIQDDAALVAEIARVLKKGGKLILSTPNKKMSLTRNPWHVREYTIDELATLLSKNFGKIDKLGVFGRGEAVTYYENNKASVKKIMRYDVLNLQYNLPRVFLQIPYDLMNRWNRRKLLSNDVAAVSSIKLDDFYIKEADDTCLDLFYIAEKA